MKSWKLNLGVFILAYVVFVLAFMPASTVVGMVNLPKNVKLGAVTGSVWNGKATALQIDNEVITNLKWDLSPFSLLVGGINADVNFGKSRQKETISGKGNISSDFSFASVDLSDFTLRYPASGIVKKMNLPIPATLSGQMVFNIGGFEQGKPYCEQLAGVVVWNKAGADVMGKSVNLGKLRAQLSCDKGQLVLKVKDKNPLGLQIDVTVADKGKLSGKGFVKPDGTMSTDVHQTVQTMFGPADSQGRFPITL